MVNLLQLIVVPYLGFYRRQKTDISTPHTLLHWFQGEFDNSNQVKDELSKNTKNKHEFITAKFSKFPLKKDLIFFTSAYYFGKNLSDVFRFRLYEFENVTNSWIKPLNFSKKPLRMKIYRPKLQTSMKLKCCEYNLSKFNPSLDDFEYLNGCDVIWKFNPFLNRFRGKLENGRCEICSQSNPNVKLVATDNIVMYRNELFILDRVTDLNGRLIVGHVDGIPYKLRRIH
jgi:hypothetical protein